MKTGIIGGTFDPIHIGHLLVAEEARRVVGLDKVIFIPAGRPWMREESQVTPADHRIAMVRLATKPNKNFEVDTVEADREGDTYTVDTIEALRMGQGKEVELYLIIGADLTENLAKWKQPEKVLRLCTLVVATRPGHKGEGLEQVRRATKGEGKGVVWITEPQVKISSTDIRRRVAEGRSITGRVTGEVEEYIYAHRLYKGATHK